MIRIGVDFGGTKIEAAALDAAGQVLVRLREPNPRLYDASLQVVRDLINRVEDEVGLRFDRVGVGMPGSLSPRTGRIRNANSTWLNDRAMQADLERALERPVRMANDADCLALSEAVEGAGAGAGVVFAAILGTGCGGGVAVEGKLVKGRNGFAGEWGHTPLPWPQADEHPGPQCWCGRRGCLETWISGTSFAADGGANAEELVARMRAGDPTATQAFDRYVSRLARGLAVVCNLIDPDVLVLGGGMSNVAELAKRLPAAIAPHVFSDVFETPVLTARHGDSSGVRGAAWLW